MRRIIFDQIDLESDPTKIYALDHNQETFYCGICYSDKKMGCIKYLDCGHYYCADCFSDYYDFIIGKEGKVYKMKCPTPKCDYTINEEVAKQLMN